MEFPYATLTPDEEIDPIAVLPPDLDVAYDLVAAVDSRLETAPLENMHPEGLVVLNCPFYPLAGLWVMHVTVDHAARSLEVAMLGTRAAVLYTVGGYVPLNFVALDNKLPFTVRFTNVDAEHLETLTSALDKALTFTDVIRLVGRGEEETAARVYPQWVTLGDEDDVFIETPFTDGELDALLVLVFNCAKTIAVSDAARAVMQRHPFGPLSIPSSSPIPLHLVSRKNARKADA